MNPEQSFTNSLNNREKLKEFLKQVAISAAMTAVPGSVQFIAEVTHKAYELWFASPSAERVSYLSELSHLSETERSVLSAEVASYTGLAESEAFEILKSIQNSPDLSIDINSNKSSISEYSERAESLNRSRQSLFRTLMGISQNSMTLEEPNHSPIIPGFEIIRFLGRGANGTVYLARQVNKAGRPCAIKVGNLDSPFRFKREIKALKEVSHEHLIELWGSGVISGNPSQYWIAMPNTGGVTLADLWRGGEVELLEKLRMMDEVLSGLAALHHVGIIHRDLKPENILITPDLTVRVADFGLSKSTIGTREVSMTLTKDGLKGTPAYMSPEQINQDRSAGLEIDIWAFGVMLYEALRGSRPFQGQNIMVLGNEVLNKELDFTGDWLPSELSDILKKCLARNLSQRYKNANQLKRHYQAAVEEIHANSNHIHSRLEENTSTSAIVSMRNKGSSLRSSFQTNIGSKFKSISFDLKRLIQLIDFELKVLKEREEERDRISLQSMIDAGKAFKGNLSLVNGRVYYEYKCAQNRPGPRHDYQYMYVKKEGGKVTYYQDILINSSVIQLCRTTRQSSRNRVELVGLDLTLISNQTEGYLLPPPEDFVLLENLKAMLIRDNLNPKIINKDLLQVDRVNHPRIQHNIQYEDIKQGGTVVIGPPGCGKTYTIANLIIEALRKGSRILVCAFTNAALSALCAQSSLNSLMRSGRLKKWALSKDESERFPQLARPSSTMIARGDVHLMTVYKLSQVWSEYINQVDLIILDEAGQVLLPVFEMIAQLNVPFLAVGDDRQLPAITLAEHTGVLGSNFTNGFKTLVNSSLRLEKLALNVTYRLSERATRYTSLFYNTPLRSNSQSTFQVKILGKQLNGDGPVLILIDDHEHSIIAQRILSSLSSSKSIGVLSTSERATRELQTVIKTPNAFIDTVYRSQGHTFDYVIFSMPQATENDLRGGLFNVATSRAREFTFILMNHDRRFNHAQNLVRQYLTRLVQEREYVLDMTSSELGRVRKYSVEETRSATWDPSLSRQRTVEPSFAADATSSVQDQLKKLPYTFKRKKT